ncbi:MULTISPECIES: hypothetical protein [Streptomyces]|uniref:DUF4232 domain-containing protein n=1 Tax=Streptomyces cadmiisoli TaxID=2184053 RepID=A0A2Z4J0J8_9ACTN|nr:MULTISPECIES: hypothetical protein [Streptomyces]AWW38308.1 hypothetical protein DN051_17965 [Streptomyces cadmiisoli]
MGSLRNPVGPLPSSIYWRRRAIMLSVLALLALLVAWFLMAGGGGGGNGAKGPDGKNPAPSITPGPSGSGPAISEAPGGRDESGDGDSAGSGENGSGDGSGEGAGAGGSGGSGDGGSSAGSGGAGSGGVVSGGGAGAGDTLPAGSTLPNCSPNAAKFTLRSERNSYSPDETPVFRLAVQNSSGSDCKVDLGPKKAILTITQASGDDAYWSSDDCPEGSGSLLYRVPAGSGITYTVEWDRKPSAPGCGTPPAGAAGAGTYLLEASAPGFKKARTSFVLAAD